MDQLKQQIIRTAFDLFSQYGIKSVSMDDIARNLRISKRTLYGYFSDKETLLIDGMGASVKRIAASLGILEKGDYTAVDILILFYEEQMKQPRWYNKRFYEDLKKYPNAMAKAEEQKMFFKDKFVKLFNRGVKEGVIQKDVNFEIIAILAHEQVKMLHPSKTFAKHSNTEVYDTLLIAFLRGVSTTKGQLILDRWITKRQVDQIDIM